MHADNPFLERQLIENSYEHIKHYSDRMKKDAHPVWLNRFAKLISGATFILIFIGGLVTSTGSGLSVPDWPTTFGHFMFSYPLSGMVGGILYEHGHRMVASTVGFLTVILTAWVWLREERKWMKWLTTVGLVTVIIQGILGGITVLYRLPTAISVSHGCLAQAFFMLTIALSVFTSRQWLAEAPKSKDKSKLGIFNLAVATTCIVYIQLILGAVMRHTGAGLAIPDFPLAFGKIIPPLETQAVAIHFLHRVWAVVVIASVILTVTQIIRHHREKKMFVKLAVVLSLALMLQVTLAAFTIWTQKAFIPTTAHVATGAFILATSLLISLRAYSSLQHGEHATQHKTIFNPISAS